jgi:hypothetical protein
MIYNFTINFINIGINIGVGVLNFWIYKTKGKNKLNLYVAYFCGGAGVIGLIIDLFKLAIKINGTI